VIVEVHLCLADTSNPLNQQGRSAASAGETFDVRLICALLRVMIRREAVDGARKREVRSRISYERGSYCIAVRIHLDCIRSLGRTPNWVLLLGATLAAIQPL
jgi:hypothetical protein